MCRWRSTYSSYWLAIASVVLTAVICCSRGGHAVDDSGPESYNDAQTSVMDSSDVTKVTLDDSGGNKRAPQDDSSAPVDAGRPDDAEDSASTAEDSATKVDASPPVSGEIVFSIPSGTFEGSLSVGMSTGLSSAEIRYTTDGTRPTPKSTQYTGTPLSINGTTRLQAQAFIDGTPQGPVGTALYVARAFNAEHDLPVIVLDAYGSGEPSTTDRSYVDVAFLAFDLVDGSTSLAKTPTLASLAAYHVRGQSSARFDKLSYRIELRDETDEDRDCELFGMPSEADWALVGPHADKTLVHNNFVYTLGRDMGLAAPGIVSAEVYLNVDDQPLARDDYQGVYQVVEVIKNQKNRLDLAQLELTDTALPDITGGYIFKFDWRAAETPLVQCPGGGPTCWSDMQLVDPDPPAPEQMTYLENHLKEFNDAIHSMTPADPTTGYPAFVDVPSFIDHIIVNEFTRSMDAYVRSQYFYKDRGDKIFAGPLWDFDLIAGVGMGGGGFFGRGFPNLETSGWQMDSNTSRMPSDWFEILFAESNFQAQLSSRWRELRRGLLSDASINDRIDQITAGLANAAERNFQRWNILSQPMVMPFTTPTEPTWAGQVEYMRNWLLQRAAWLDTQW